MAVNRLPLADPLRPVGRPTDLLLALLTVLGAASLLGFGWIAAFLAALALEAHPAIGGWAARGAAAALLLVPVVAVARYTHRRGYRITPVAAAVSPALLTALAGAGWLR
ncbi:hypothetical protein [Kitasatospora sp. NPDC058046]|uniref:hypothetical protein n=1 Tax=Kitasatospora sp. NPDC058046 TaxID=3346312 RepID=UPI0036DEDC25